jgi:zinc protease
MRSLVRLTGAFAAFGALCLSLPASAAPRATLAPSADARRAWGFDATDLKPDPTVRFGVLPNGMRYAIMHNETPKHNASVRMRFDVGSTAEADDQRGLAHFLEHMAFNGSTHVPEGEMVKLLERLGLAFGADTNASTSFTETVYKLDLPEVNDALIDKALFLMRETASELTLDPAAIDRERGVILGEARARDNYGLRQFKDFSAFFAPGSPLAKGLPIGSEAVIRTAPAARLRDLYDRFYTPERATLIVVGDVDVAAVEAKITATFANWKARGHFGGDPALAAIDANRPTSAHLFKDADVPTSVSLFVAKPFLTERETVAVDRRRTLEGLGTAILNRRFARLARAADARFTSAQANNGPFVSTAETAQISVTAKDRDWATALAVGEQELRRALTRGFTKSELAEQIATLRRGYEDGVAQASSRRSAELAGSIAINVEADGVFTTPEADLAFLNAITPEITLERVNAAFSAAWSGANPQLLVSHNAEIAGGSDAILRRLTESRAVAVAPVSDTSAAAFAHTQFGKPGQVAADARIADLDLRTLRFANNVRLNIKHTDFEKGKIRVSLRLGGGALELPQSPDGLAIFTGFALPRGGTTAHSADALQSLLAGHSVSPSITTGQNAFGAEAITIPADLLLQLQVLAGFITAPGYRSDAESQWKNVIGVWYPTLDSQPSGVAARDVARIIAGGDTRAGFGTLDALKARNFSELRPLLGPIFNSGPIEIGIVGDVDEMTAIAAVAQTFGALPTRAADRRDYGQNHPYKFPASRAPITLTHGGLPNHALALVYWPTTDNRDFKTEQGLTLLTAVMQLMLTDELREKLGATYSPSTGSTNSADFPGYGYIGTSSNVEPGKVDTVYGAIDKIASALAAKPIDADLMLRARAPMLETVARQRRENGRWLGIVAEAQSRPDYLDRFRMQEAVLKDIDAARLQALARTYLSPAAALRMRIIPRGGTPAK